MRRLRLPALRTVLWAVATAGVVAGADRASSPTCTEAAAWCPSLAHLEAGGALPEAIHILDRTGTPVAHVAGARRLSLEPEDIPPLVARAFVAVEDRRFYQHGGVDGVGALRAAVRNVRAGAVEEGASTIPMQLVRTLWADHLKDVGRWRRKVIEARTAPRLVRRLGHDRVLTLYLNAIYMGNGIYGVGGAARYYFDAPLDSLDAGQVATLVGMTRAPELYEPNRHPERARSRRDVVLELLAREGILLPEEADAARRAPLETVPPRPEMLRRSYVTAAVTRELRRVAPELAGAWGLRVHTTLDRVVQERGEATVRSHVEELEAGRFGRLAGGEAPVQMAAVALDPATGAVRGWIGGRDFDASEFDRVDQARRPVGSLVKPFVVAEALSRGVGIVDLVSSDTAAFREGEGAWLPRDHVDARALPLREALIQSSNRAAVHLGYRLGLDAVGRVARRVGMEGPVPELPAAYIGAFDASLLELTAAFAVFGNGGRRVEPYLIERIEDAEGRILWQRPDDLQPEPVLDPAVSWVVLDALRAVVDHGTGWGVRAAGFSGDAAGKTGTTDGARDAWFVGLTPDLVAGVWVGYDVPSPTVAGGSGGTLAAPAWGRWMAALPAAVAVHAWTPPLGVTQVRYDRATGRVVEPSCPGFGEGEALDAWVRVGRYPADRCPSGLSRFLRSLWSVFTPRAAPVPPPLPIREGRGGGPGGD